jgi:MarR family transcriptional regulator, organic hydroperoxide resistance regulator
MANTGKRRLARAHPSKVASHTVRKQPGSGRRLHAQGVQTIEGVLSPDRQPVLGLYLHTVHILLLRSLSRQPRFRSIMPHLIGTPALLSKHPGLSQIELAALLGTERATAGLQVAQCIEKGFVRRSVSAGDRRKYELYVTDKGLRLLAEAQRVVPDHEDLFAKTLTLDERETLRRLLMKLIAE